MKIDETKQVIPEGYYTIDEMCQLLNLKRNTFNTARTTRRDKLPPETKIGHLILYNKESFKEWLKEREEKRELLLRPKNQKGLKPGHYYSYVSK